jgi:hypothetical protein
VKNAGPSVNAGEVGDFREGVFPNWSGSIPPLRALGFMDHQTKHEIWVLAIGTILIEAPFVAMAALALSGSLKPG